MQTYNDNTPQEGQACHPYQQPAGNRLPKERGHDQQTKRSRVINSEDFKVEYLHGSSGQDLLIEDNKRKQRQRGGVDNAWLSPFEPGSQYSRYWRHQDD